jgi:hypothetical protein
LKRDGWKADANGLPLRFSSLCGKAGKEKKSEQQNNCTFHVNHRAYRDAQAIGEQD